MVVQDVVKWLPKTDSSWTEKWPKNWNVIAEIKRISSGDYIH